MLDCVFTEFLQLLARDVRFFEPSENFGSGKITQFVQKGEASNEAERFPVLGALL